MVVAMSSLLHRSREFLVDANELNSLCVSLSVNPSVSLRDKDTQTDTKDGKTDFAYDRQVTTR